MVNGLIGPIMRWTGIDRVVVVSYRRSDAVGRAGRLQADLVRELGPENVFMDLDSIRPGNLFTEVIDSAISAADVLVLMIGPTWTTVVGSDGTRRLDQPDDPVRREIETALAHDLTVIPVLIGGATMPPRHALPDSIASIADIHALDLVDRYWPSGVETLIAALAHSPRRRPGRNAIHLWLLHRRRLVLATALVLTAALVLALADPLGLGSTGWPGGGSATSDPRLLFSEDFDGDELDPERWNLPAQPDLIYSRGGALTLELRGDGPSNGRVAHLLPRDVGSFNEIRFDASILSSEAAGPGGAGVTVTERSGRTHRLVFGPSPPDQLNASALVCAQPRCSQYDDYLPPEVFAPMALGERVPMRMVREGSELTISVRDQVIGRVRSSEPLVRFSIDLDGAATEKWRIAIDSIRVFD